MGPETGKRIAEEKQSRKYRSVFIGVSHSFVISFIAIISSKHNARTGSMRLCCLLIIPFQLPQGVPLHGSTCLGAKFKAPFAKPSSSPQWHPHSQNGLRGRCIVFCCTLEQSRRPCQRLLLLVPWLIYLIGPFSDSWDSYCLWIPGLGGRPMDSRMRAQLWRHKGLDPCFNKRQALGFSALSKVVIGQNTLGPESCPLYSVAQSSL